MKCPACPDTTLVMSDRQGVEIDYCPACRGIWLDRGELDKLLERANTAPTASAQQNVQTANSRHQPNFEDSDHHHTVYRQRTRKKSWLNEIFD
jgi:uncharacterized protein